MWKKVGEIFGPLPARKAVAMKMLALGLRIDANGKVMVGDVEVKDKSLAAAAGVDRRAVAATISVIRKDRFLSGVFSRIQPAGAFLEDVAQLMGFGVVELEADAKRPGIISKVAGMLAERGISIRQIYAHDPELFENPSLVVIAEREIPGKLLNEFKRIRGVKRVIIR